jgi:hypothetical protein
MGPSPEPPVVPLLRRLYAQPTPVRTDWGHHRIFAQQAYRTVREAAFVPIVMAEALDLARWFPLCWVVEADGEPVLAAFRSLLGEGGGLPAGAGSGEEALPLVLQAFPFVVPDDEAIASRAMSVDSGLADRPTDIGAPILGEDGKFTRAARARARTAVHVGHCLPATREVSRALHDRGLMKPWAVDLELGEGRRATFDNLWIVDTDRLDDPALHGLMAGAGIEAALLLSAHRLSLFRMNALLQAARRDLRRALEAPAAAETAIDLP